VLILANGGGCDMQGQSDTSDLSIFGRVSHRFALYLPELKLELVRLLRLPWRDELFDT
jgi:hypothetical protein